MFLLVLLQDGTRRYLLGAVTVPSGFLRALLDVLVLALFLFADTLEVLLTGHDVTSS